MPSPADAAIAAMFGAIQATNGGVVLVSRGTSTFSITAVPEEVQEHELNFLTRTFLVRNDEFGAALPGDVWTINGERYEVRPFEGEVPWAWLDDAHTQRVVHTKAIGWARDTLTFEQPRRILTAGDQRPQKDELQAVTGLVRAIGGSESYQAEIQQLAFTDYRAIVPSTATTRAIRPQDKFKFTTEGRCRTVNVAAVRDPGTNGSVLYIECREQMN